MTPTERQRLADAMTVATGQRWRVAAAPLHIGVEWRGFWVNIDGDGDGALYWFAPHPSGEGLTVRRVDLVGESLDLLAAAAAVAIAGVLASLPVKRKTTTARDTRRSATFRALLRPDSGASESERAQARAHLERLGS